MVFKRLVEGDVQKAENAKIAVYTCPFDSAQTETKVIFIIGLEWKQTCFFFAKSINCFHSVESFDIAIWSL